MYVHHKYIAASIYQMPTVCVREMGRGRGVLAAAHADITCACCVW